MINKFRLFTFFLLPLSTCFADPVPDSSTTLQFKPSHPVTCIVKTEMHTSQILSTITWNTISQQKVTFDLMLESSTKYSTYPYTLCFALKELEIDLMVNDKHVIYNTNDINSPEFAQLTHLVDYPIYIPLASTFEIAGPIIELEQISKKYTLIKEFFPETFFTEVVQYLFACSGRNLQLNMEYLTPIRIGAPFPLETTLLSEVTAIEDKQIVTKHTGDIYSEGILTIQGNTEILLLMSGSVNAEGSWNSENGMICQFNISCNFQGKGSEKNKEWPIKISIFQTLSTGE